MLPMLLKPKAAASVPVFSTLGYTRLWATTTKNGAVSGTALSDTGTYSVKWWDGTTSSYSSGDTFSKSGSGTRAFDVYPSSPTVLDSSSNGFVGSLSGAATIASDQSMFGSSGSFRGTGGYVGFAQNDAFKNWGSDDWTIEMWLRPSSVSGYASLFNQFGQIHLHIYGSGDLYLNDSVTGSGGLQLSGVLSTGSWQHVAVVRQSGVSSVYVNGTRVGYGSVPYGNYSGSLFMGSGYLGYMDELRVVRGTALYSGASFTPPSSALSAVSGTALLLHFDSAVFAPSGNFTGFEVNGNEITKLRGEQVILGSTPGQPYYQWNKTYGSVITRYGDANLQNGDIGYNSLAASDLNAFYTDLLDNGSGSLTVTANPGIDADDPTIATAKGYTIYGSVPP